MKNLTKPQKAWGVGTILLVLVSLVVFWPKGKEPIEPKRTHTVVTKTILIEYDVEYKLLSFGSVGAKLVKGKTKVGLNPTKPKTRTSTMLAGLFSCEIF